MCLRRLNKLKAAAESLLFLLLLSVSLSAGAGERYTLPQLISMAVASRPEMRIAASRIAESEGTIREAKSYYFPELNADASYTRLNEKPYLVVPPTMVNAGIDLSGIKADYPILAAVPDQITVPITVPQTKAIIAGEDVFRLWAELKQPLYTGGKIKERVRQANYLKGIYRSQERRSTDEIKEQVETLYFQLVFAGRALGVVEDIEARIGIVAKFLENAYKNYKPKEGEKGVDRADHLKSKYVLSKIRGYKSEVLRLGDEARKLMAITCGLETDAFSVVDEAEKYVHHLPTRSLVELENMAISNRAEMRQVGLLEDITASDVRRVKAGYVPDIGIFGHYRLIKDDNPGDQENLLAVGVGASIPIFNGFRTHGEIIKAKAARRKARSEKELVKLKIISEVEILYNKMDDYMRKIDIGMEALNHAKLRRQLEAESYLLDTLEYEDYLEALEDEVMAELALLRTRAEYYTALSGLHLALGLRTENNL